MRRPLGSDRRIIRRPGGARFHRDAQAGGRFGTVERSVLARAARRDCEPEWSADAVADRERAVACEPARHASAGAAGVGCRAVPRAGVCARPMDGRS